jgi:predicted AAA+ superfamily ATPase
MIHRLDNVKKLEIFRDTRLIKVVSGIRRSGKSTLLELYRNHLLESGVSKEQIIEINLEDPEYRNFDGYLALYDYINAKLLRRRPAGIIQRHTLPQRPRLASRMSL